MRIRLRNQSIAFRMIVAGTAAIGLTACGGGDGDGSSGIAGQQFTGVQTEATVTFENAEEIGTAAAEAAVQAVSNNGASSILPTLALASNDNAAAGASLVIQDIAADLVDPGLGNTVVGITITPTEEELATQYGDLYCGGGYTADFEGNQDNFEGIILYQDFCVNFDFLGDSVEYTLNGQHFFRQAGDVFTQNFAVDMAGSDDSEASLRYSIACQGDPPDCELFSDFPGRDGRIYRISDYTVIGSTDTGYGLTGRFFHPDYGSVDVTMSNVTFECADQPPGWQPGTGSLTFSGTGGSSGGISFDNGCTSYTWSFGGNSEINFW